MPDLCTCNSVDPPGNRLHCLQSQEGYAIGSTEGFGHYFSTRVWNDTVSTSPIFQYYKQFKEAAIPATSTTPAVPAKVLPAGAKIVNTRLSPPVKWADTNCSSTATGRSTEYDFLGFYWATLAVPGSGRISIPQFYSVLDTLRNLSTDSGHDGSWAAYVMAAQAALGNSAAVGFIDNGPLFGIAH